MSAAGRRLPPEARRAQLLTAARRVLAEDGLGAFTLAAVAARAQVTGPLLRHYFGSRDGLLVAVCRQLLDEVMGTLLAGVEGGGLEPRLRAYLERIAQDPWGHTLWMHGREVHPEIDAAVREARSRLAAFSFALDWQRAGSAERAAALGWVGYVESVVSAWVDGGADDVHVPLAVLMDGARRLGVRDL